MVDLELENSEQQTRACFAARAGNGDYVLAPIEAGYVLATLDLYCNCHMEISVGDIVQDLPTDGARRVPRTLVKNPYQEIGKIYPNLKQAYKDLNVSKLNLLCS